jgi:hypothetical protein
MRFGITQLVMGSAGMAEISEQEYQAISLARRNLFEALFLEEKFDIVIENYYEYETELLSSASRFMLFGDQNPSQIQGERILISRRIVNLLSAGRLYLDQSAHHLSNIYGNNSTASSELEREKSTEYDARLGYRVMEALRNYVQHRGFPIHSVALSWHLVEQEPNKKNKYSYTATPLIKPAELEDDSGFKRAVLEDLKAIGDEVDLKPLAREYMECLSRVHDRIREILRSDVSDWETKIHSTIDRYKAALGEQAPIIGLAIVKETEDGMYAEEESIFTEFLERRRKLEKKNGILTSLALRYVTGESRE